MSWTIRWRTTSAEPSSTNATPSMSSSTPRTLEQPRAVAPLGEIDLGDVAGDDHPRAEAEAGEEHLHLLGRGVLGLVEDDERVVERAAPHERERRDLDRAPLHQPGHGLGVEHVVQGVVQRTEVRVDLGEDVAGEEAEALPRLDRRPGEDDPVDRLGLERLHRGGHREVALAGAGGADPEGDRVGRDGVDVALLATGLRPDRLAAPQHLGGEHLTGSFVALHHVDGAPDAFGVEGVAALEEQDHLLEEACSPGRRRPRRPTR